ncbi:hypothetical protein ACIBLB_35780 [Streptosporangium canum]|uniref:hypothetical protein n=1 Tax=Streptosporangium canum TaxID=324952 RepID=UPI00379D33C9
MPTAGVNRADVSRGDAEGWDGTRTCMKNGLELDNPTGIYPYDGRPGQGESLNDNISAHRWSNNC